MQPWLNCFNTVVGATLAAGDAEAFPPECYGPPQEHISLRKLHPSAFARKLANEVTIGYVRVSHAGALSVFACCKTAAMVRPAQLRNIPDRKTKWREAGENWNAFVNSVLNDDALKQWTQEQFLASVFGPTQD